MVNLAFCELTGLSLLLTKFELLPFGIHLMDSYKIYVIGFCLGVFFFVSKE